MILCKCGDGARGLVSGRLSGWLVGRVGVLLAVGEFAKFCGIVAATPVINPGGCSTIGERPREPRVGEVGRDEERALKSYV